nr:hypothetical protein [Vibrio anguillarum]
MLSVLCGNLVVALSTP